MANILYLVHRLPFPPNKGDKVRSFNLLKHLAARHKVYLGTFVDDDADMQHLPAVRSMCAGLCAVRLKPAVAKIRSLTAMVTGEPLGLAYYRSSELQAWVSQTRADCPLDATIIFSSVMGQYAPDSDAPHKHPLLVDFVDVDSEKWAQYATQRSWPMSWVYGREGRTLLRYERALAARATRGFFVTDKETELFQRLAPECAGQVQAVANGVDSDYFSPDPLRENPFAAGDLPIVFTGAMDYWPNIDAVVWFAEQVLPPLREKWRHARFVVVGRSPSAEVRRLASPEVLVTGTVADVRPYIQHAAVIVAPMRLSRGVQNKVLEAMAMARPVVAAADCVSAIHAPARSGIVAAEVAAEYVAAIDGLLGDPARAGALALEARSLVRRWYSWEAQLSAIDPLLLPPSRPGGTDSGKVLA